VLDLVFDSLGALRGVFGLVITVDGNVEDVAGEVEDNIGYDCGQVVTCGDSATCTNSPRP
jgi:hypothetical protein